MDEKFSECAGKLRKLVSDIQGAPYPGKVNDELYLIWYEHVQQHAMDCFEFLDENFPSESSEIEDAVRKIT
ncbi:MAG: hypothetical protein ACTTHG_05835 [Treponemataceae bacterium]